MLVLQHISNNHNHDFTFPAYRSPYLYVVYFNTLQVVEILPTHDQETYVLHKYQIVIYFGMKLSLLSSVSIFGNFSKGGKKFLNIVNPRYLGPALTPSAVYIASMKENDTEIICFKGNMGGRAMPEDEIKENIRDYNHKTYVLLCIISVLYLCYSVITTLLYMPFNVHFHHLVLFRPSRTAHEDMEVSSDDSPMRIRKMSNSPGRSLPRGRAPPSTSTDSEVSSTADSCFGTEQTNLYHSSPAAEARRIPRHSQSEARDGQSHHKTVVTLDRFLKEQSVKRAQHRQEGSGQQRTVTGLKGVFETPGRRPHQPSTSSEDTNSTF